MTHVRIEAQVQKLKLALAVMKAQRDASNRFEARAHGTVEKVARENATLAQAMLAHNDELKEVLSGLEDARHQLEKVTAERDGFRARAEKAEAAINAAAFDPREGRVTELLHNIPPTPGHIIGEDTLDTLSNWLAELRKAVE